MRPPKYRASMRLYQIRLHEELVSGIREYQDYIRNKTGITISLSDAVRGLLQQTLENKGLYESEPPDKDSE